jgi:hypothetical protein
VIAKEKAATMPRASGKQASAVMSHKNLVGVGLFSGSAPHRRRPRRALDNRPSITM